MLVVLSLLLVAASGKEKRLSEAEQAHFYALKPYLEKDQEKAFLKLKTQAERDAYLKDLGLWDRFYKYDEAQRDQIVAGEVEIGWYEDMVIMAWGPPYQKRRMTSRPATRSELYLYRFEVDKRGVVRVFQPDSRTAYKMVDRFQTELYIDDGRVTEILRKEEWE
jgi:hypothetical protein